MKTFAILAALAFAASAFALDLTTTDGKVYKNVEITLLSPIGMKFICDGKSGWADFRDLTPDLQKTFGYDPKAAAAFEQKLVSNNGFASITPQTPPAQQPAPSAPAATAPAPAVQPTAQTTAQDAQTQDQLIAQQTPPDLSAYPPDAQPVSQPPPGANVIDCSTSVPDTLSGVQFSAGPAYCANSYVLWGGMYYPAYYWCHWWNDHNWVWHNGHYYPWNYYNHHGVWENGKYYPYEHGRLYQSDPWQNRDKDVNQYKNQFHESRGYVPRENFGGTHYRGGGGRR